MHKLVVGLLTWIFFIVGYSALFFYVNLIYSIASLSKVGVDMEPFFARQEQEKIIVAWIKNKYNVTRDKRGINIASINY